MNAPIPSAAAGDATREVLISAAERLFAEFGIHGVSLRSISKEARCGNVVAVQYHFGDKLGLIKAIFGRRLPAMEDIRRRMLQESGDDPQQIPPSRLVEIMVMPLMKMIDENGKMTFVRFLLQYSALSEYWGQTEHPIPHRYRFREPRAEDGPTAKTFVLISQKFQHVPIDVLVSRVNHMTRMFLGALVEREDALSAGIETWPLERFVKDQIAMITSALATPAA